MKTPILETERLILRPLCVNDADQIFKNWASDPEVARYMTWSVHENAQVTREWLLEVEKGNDLERTYDWGFERKLDHVLIGSGGIYYKEDRGMFTLGYNIMKSCWNQGYMSEAAARILEYATEVLLQKKLFAYYAKDNPNSGKVMEKVGFHYVRDTEYDSMDGTRHFEAREYLFEKEICESLQNPLNKFKYSKYEYAENVFDTRLIEKDKLTFVVLAGIVNNRSRLVITDHKRFVICHSEAPYPVWIWVVDNITEDELSDIWDCVQKELEEGYHFNTKYFVADYFIKRSKEEKQIPFEITLNLCVYDCQEPIEPARSPDGKMRIATNEDLSDATAFIQQFKQDIGLDMEPEEQCFKKAKSWIENGDLYFWKNDEGKNVAMCSISADETIGKITHVFTEREKRRKGYAQSLVYEVTGIVRSKGLLPVLYTDADYTASNECYKKIGYVERGGLCTISNCKV